MIYETIFIAMDHYSFNEDYRDVFLEDFFLSANADEYTSMIIDGLSRDGDVLLSDKQKENAKRFANFVYNNIDPFFIKLKRGNH